MSNPFQPAKPFESEFLVVFCDLTGFTRLTQARASLEVFEFVEAWYELSGDAVESAGGRLVKFIGDAFMAVFPGDRAEDGILAMLKLREEGDAMMARSCAECRTVVKAHFGPVAAGMAGTRREKRFDVFGETVNATALLKSTGFAITPQAFRKLGPQARKLFKKHTPPVSYIPLSEKRPRG